MEIKQYPFASQPPMISPEKTPLLTTLASDEMVSNNSSVWPCPLPSYCKKTNPVLAETRTCSLNVLTKLLLTSTTGEKMGTTSYTLKNACYPLSSNQSFPCPYQPSSKFSREGEVDMDRQVLRSV